MNPHSAIRVSCWRALLCFLFGNVFLLPLIFGDALWGKSLLAPLDIPAVLFPKYEYIDPAHAAVPANHFIIDGIFYDLPLQKTIHEAYSRGEIPWWDPYSLGGRPLLADAHVNGTDWIRLVIYRLLPFELAFNWTRVAHFFFTGLGMLLLLRHFRFGLGTCVLLALTHEFATGFAMFFCHPWIQSSFLFYPCIWLLWDDGWDKGFGWREGLAGLLAAGVFYSGNLQSHTYLPLLALAFCLGYGGKSLASWKRALGIVASTGLIGACLAGPVLLNQLELYFTGVRMNQPTDADGWRDCLSGVVSLSAIYPWMLGTFRTLDLGKWVGDSGLGFLVYIGSAAFGLALMNFFFPGPEHTPRRRMAMWLLATYFVLILSTPLKKILYARSSGLAVLGLIVLAAFMIERLRHMNTRSAGVHRAGIVLLAITAALIVVSHVGALWIYPRLTEKIRAFVSARSDPSAHALREFQIQNWAREVTFRNPETVLAACSLLALSAVLLSSSLRRSRAIWPALLVLNAAPGLLFTHRFIPRHPVELWRRLEAGGPEQQRVAAAMAPEERLFERARRPHAHVFPNELQHLQRVRTVHGYAALQPRGPASVGLAELPEGRAQLADFTYETTDSTEAIGSFYRNSSNQLARFQWRGATDRAFRAKSEGLNRIRITFAPGATGELLWTDSPYPGWHAVVDGQKTAIGFIEPCFSSIKIPADGRELVLQYRPSYLQTGCVLTVMGLVGAAFCVLAGRRKQRQAA